MIISGNQGEGKTNFVKQLVHLLNRKSIPCAGFYAEGYWDQNLRSAFDLVEVNGSGRLCLCNLVAGENDIAFRRFYFKRDALLKGEEILMRNEGAHKIIFVDEIGMLEIDGKGWAPALNRLMLNPPLALVLTVRKTLVKSVCECFGIIPAFNWQLADTDPEDALRDIISLNLNY